MLEDIAVDEDDPVDPRLGDMVEDVAARAADANDGNRVTPVKVVQVRQADAGRVRVGVRQGQIVWNDLK
uniref:hypothetical protein n=1 Tax=unclassified Rhodococcus (in: high G+C Gram-positive bacteria) TaxID=192944 RepID=UPI0020CC810E|nr:MULTISPECIES: hypothetical protein [unclassified Rhodococcus (in: high G+C Gram-positive bacteria)]